MASSSIPPFAVWSDNDHSGPVIIATTVCMFYWLIPGVLQQIVSLFHNIRFTWADTLFTVSMASGVVQSSLLLLGSHYGLGKSAQILRQDQLEQAKRHYYVSNIIYIITLGLIKCSAALFIANLTVKNRGSLRHAPREQKFALYGVLSLSLIWTVATAIVIALPCRSENICVGTMDRWRGIFAGDLVTDVAIAAFAANVIWRTQASFRVRLVWYIPFCLRICVPFLSGLRLLTVSEAKLTTDPLLEIWLFIVMSQIQILFSLIGSATPALKKTMLDLVTNYGAVSDSQANSRVARYGGSKYGAGFPLKYLGSSKGNKDGSLRASSKRKGSNFAPFVGGGISGNASVSRGDTYIQHTGDGDSQEGIIRQDEYVVSYATAEDCERREP